MNYNRILLSTKSSGLCFNIMRLLILTFISKKHNRDLFFLTKQDHISILKLFNDKCNFIPYKNDHTKKFNNQIRNKSLHKIYDFKYFMFLKENYLSSILDNEILFKDVEFINGYYYDIINHNDFNLLIIDYNDGSSNSDILDLIEIDSLNFNCSDFNCLDVNKDILSINVKINNSNDRHQFDLWDKILYEIRKEYKDEILLISGDNNVKKELSEKYNCIYRETDSEEYYSLVRGNNIIRGNAYEIFSDVLTCVKSNFLSFEDIRIKYDYVLRDFSDINFVNEKIEKFDILVNYMSNNPKINLL